MTSIYISWTSINVQDSKNVKAIEKQIALLYMYYVPCTRVKALKKTN
jgi:hypothetical protein